MILMSHVVRFRLLRSRNYILFSFLVACTRLHPLLCPSVRPSVNFGLLELMEGRTDGRKKEWMERGRMDEGKRKTRKKGGCMYVVVCIIVKRSTRLLAC